MNKFFISDTHFGHEKIIEYCNRPFKDVDEMDYTIIRNWNQRIKKEDLIIINGDFVLDKSKVASNSRDYDYYYNQLNGHKIFICGNHDYTNESKSIIESMVINYGGYRIYITHNPKFAKKEFKWNFCGHLHGKYGKFIRLSEDSIIVDLSVDIWNFMPVTINEIFSAFAKWLKEEKNGKTK